MSLSILDINGSSILHKWVIEYSVLLNEYIILIKARKAKVKIRKKIIVAVVMAFGVVPKIESNTIRTRPQIIPEKANPENNRDV